MKKVLSVFLAVLMLFGALSVSSFAEETTAPVVTPPMAYHDWWGEGGPCSKEQAVLAFNLNGGSLKAETQVYNEETGKFEFRPVGHGCQNVAEVVEASIEAGAKWFVVEQDLSVGRTPLEAAQMSIDTLKKIGLK